jgi:hypothetical protein
MIDCIITVAIAISISAVLIWAMFNPEKAKAWVFGLFKFF